MLTPGIKGHAALRVTTENTALAMGFFCGHYEEDFIHGRKNRLLERHL